MSEESSKTAGYKRGIDGKGSSEGLVEGLFETHEEKEARREGFQEGKRDRLRIDHEESKK